jgi:hypothetical protein
MQVHAYDICRAKLDFADCAQHACTEVRDARLQQTILRIAAPPICLLRLLHLSPDSFPFIPGPCTPCALHPTPYTLHPTFFTLLPALFYTRSAPPR